MEDRKQKIDEWLDTGLKHYSDVEPREGLESRVQATVRAEQQSPSFGPARWIAIAVVLATAAALFLSRGTPTESSIPVPAAVSPPDLRASIEILTEPVRHRNGVIPKRRHTPKSPSVTDEPRLDQFPSPQPLSEQEEMLVHYVRERHREAVMVARAQAELKDNEFLSATRQLPSVEVHESQQ